MHIFWRVGKGLQEGEGRENIHDYFPYKILFHYVGSSHHQVPWVLDFFLLWSPVSLPFITHLLSFQFFQTSPSCHEQLQFSLIEKEKLYVSLWDPPSPTAVTISPSLPSHPIFRVTYIHGLHFLYLFTPQLAPASHHLLTFLLQRPLNS